jgi:hypothetical protein
MKKILSLLFLTTILALSANAQTEKSTVLLGGTLSFQTTSGVTIFNANPNFGVFVAKKVAVGAEANLLVINSATTWGIGPYARVYFAGSDKGSFFGHTGIAVLGSSAADASVNFLLRGGYAVFLNKSVALEFSAAYSRASDIDFLLIGAGFQIHLKK